VVAVHVYGKHSLKEQEQRFQQIGRIGRPISNVLMFAFLQWSFVDLLMHVSSYEVARRYERQGCFRDSQSRAFLPSRSGT
jgi:hypothetical protein